MNSNIGFDSDILGGYGVTNYCYKGTNGSTDLGGSDYQYGMRLDVTGSGSPLSTSKYGTYLSVQNNAKNNYGVYLDVAGASTNMGIYGAINNTAGSSKGIFIEHNGYDTGGFDTQKGVEVTLNGAGDALTSNKIGLEVSIQGDAFRNEAINTSTFGSAQLNYGWNCSVGSVTGNSYGFYINNSSFNPSGRDNQYGGFIDVYGSGDSSTTTHTGLQISARNDARFNFGLLVDSVYGAIEENIGVRSYVTGTIGADNAAVWGENQSYDLNGNDNQYGGYFDSNAAGTATTTKYGISATVSNTGLENFGLRVSANGGTKNHSVFSDSGRWTFRHDPNTELGVSDSEGYGDIVYFGGEGSSFSAADVVYLDSNGDWLQTNAVGTGTSINMLGIALRATVSDGILMRGYVYYSSWNFTSGVPLYLETGTAGAMTMTAPSASGEVVRIVGYSTDSTNKNRVYFNPDNTWVEL